MVNEKDINSKKNRDGKPHIPDDHPRSQSLKYRHLLVDGMNAKVVTPSGLIAHGRGEAFDYIFGEKTCKSALESIDAAVASILLADHPIISVNGNVAALIPDEVVQLSEVTGAQIEINIFYRAEGRIEAITSLLEKSGAKNILGTGDVEPVQLSNLSSNRRIVDPRGINKADVVLVPLEDGDRTEALIQKGKFVITIDLNPLSRTAQMANITIVDNLIRCVPIMISRTRQLKKLNREELNKIIENFNQKRNLSGSIDAIINYLSKKKIGN